MIWGEELADVAIYLLGLSEILGIDLEDEILKKVYKNSKREYKVINGVNTRTNNYSNSKEKILLSVNQKFELGQFYAIIGKSGAGKSTLLSLLAGLDKPQKVKFYSKMRI